MLNLANHPKKKREGGRNERRTGFSVFGPLSKAGMDIDLSEAGGILLLLPNGRQQQQAGWEEEKDKKRISGNAKSTGKN